MKSFTEFKENINETRMKMSYREWLTKTGKNHSPENVELYKKTQTEEFEMNESAGYIKVNMSQMKKWKVYSDNAREYDQIMKNNGVISTLDTRPYEQHLNDFNISYTKRKLTKEEVELVEDTLSVARHRNYARPGQGPDKHTITKDHGNAPDGSRVYSVKQPNGFHGVFAVKGDTVVGSSNNNLSKDEAHSLGAHYAKHGTVGIGVGKNWSLGSGIHGKVVKHSRINEEEVELSEKVEHPDSVKHKGQTYWHTGKTGSEFGSNEPSAEYELHDKEGRKTGKRIWRTISGRINQESVGLDESAEHKWWNTYKNNEKINAHTENIVHLANLVGDNNDKKEATEILKKHRDIGYLTQDLHDRRYALHKKLFPKVNKHFRMNEEVILDESKEYIEQHLADNDINSKVEGKTVKVHSSDIVAAKKHLAKAGYKDHKVVGGLNEGYVVTLHHTHPDGKKEEFHYKIKSAKSDKHAGRIARLIHDKKNIPNKFVSFEPSKDVKLIEQSELEESRGHKLLSKALARMDTRKKIASGEIKVGAKRDEPPFDNAHPTGEKKDEFGNVVKNRAQHLAKKGMSSVSESDDLDESPSEYSANTYLAGSASGKKSGHYLKRGDSYVDHVAHPTVDHATKAWHNLKDKSGVKIVKETNNMLSYSEFVAKLDEGKIDDLKDRLAAAREKRLSTYDFSKEKGEKKPGVTVHRSKNYGNGDEDGNESNPEVQSTVKRGRGRPKGSKSGARV